MRWKAKIDDPSGAIELQRMVAAFSRLVKAKECRLRLSPEKIYLVDLGDSEETGKIWCEVQNSSVFSSFKIESLHANNEILIIINVEQLSRALKSTMTAASVTCKLTKRDGVHFVSIIIISKSHMGADRPITQDIPIAILHHDQIDEIKPPELRTPEVNIYLPVARILKNVVERMKVLSDHVMISANEDGEVNLMVETSDVTVKTYFKDLQNAEWKNGSVLSQQRKSQASQNFVSASIPVKKFFAFIAAHQADSANILLSIVQGKTVVISVIHEGSTLTLYIPVLLDD